MRAYDALSGKKKTVYWPARRSAPLVSGPAATRLVGSECARSKRLVAPPPIDLGPVLRPEMRRKPKACLASYCGELGRPI